jgi:translation initiation factor 6 (eIF-6)
VLEIKTDFFYLKQLMTQNCNTFGMNFLIQFKVETIQDRLSALGNVIACNDHVAIVHPDLDKVC